MKCTSVALRLPVLAVVFALLASACGPEDPANGDAVSTEMASTSGYAGFDISAYPDSPADLGKMRWLKSRTNLQFTGFYLGGGARSGQAPHHEDNSWMSNRQTLKNAGWGFAPVYVGRQQETDRAIMTKPKGVSDGQAAANLMVNAGFPTGSVVYLDVENGQPLSSEMGAYYQGWNDGVVSAGFIPGVYCSYLLANALRAIDNRPVFWVFRIASGTSECLGPLTTQFSAGNPSDSGVPYATVWQLHSQNCPQWMSDNAYNSSVVNKIDYDVSSVPDPSRVDPHATTPTSFFPSNWQVASGNQLTLSWSGSPMVISYQVWVYVWVGNGWLVYGHLTGSSNQMALNNFPIYTYPYAYVAWNVTACNGWGCAPTSAWQYGIYQR